MALQDKRVRELREDHNDTRAQNRSGKGRRNGGQEGNGLVSIPVFFCDYGKVEVKLAEVLRDRDMTRHRLHTLTGVKYEVVDRYYKAENIEMVDLDFIAKVCYVLDCRIEDLLEYRKK